MPRVVGIDPGTVSFDVLGLDDGQVFLQASLPTAEVARGPDALVELLRSAGPLDLVAGPSGYGLPLVPIEAVGERELALMFLARTGEPSPLGGLRAMVRRFAEERLPVVFTPGVIHLPTVPAHRKVNRIDMGTADKVCATAAAIDDQARRRGVPCAEASFVLVELGGAFTAVVSVEGGRIVGGQGGSSGALGFLGSGALDGEAACLLPRVGKETVFSGGVAYVAGDPGATPEALAARGDEAWLLARDALVDSVVRAVAAERAGGGAGREIVLSGRLSRVEAFRDPVAAALAPLGPVRRPEGGGSVKEAARGAALIADGLAGGRHRELVEAMALRGARGTVLDWLYLSGAGEVREWASPVGC
jgi:predicted butyrate kinase (DUF1464 family)